ncbi:spermatogenesis-associated protein 1-like isoform X6 [Ptychodera flava]|uniref:spermatogenesis-associated protein 1-like isoform X6 n=1 Tax=Ptychodera flava TaxID=63121 RepID=UPI00396A4249
MSTRLSNAIERPPSEQLSDLHVYVIPSESWNEKFRSAYNEVINESVSAGFVRVFPEITVFALRDEIEEQLGYDVLPKEYVFLKSVGRCLTQVKGRQEIDLKVKNFLPPLAYLPEIFVLPGQRDNVPLALPSTETYKSQRHKAVTGGDVDGFSQPGHNSATPDPFSIEHHYSQKTPLQEEGQEGYLAPLSATPPQTPDVVPVESPLQRKTKVAGKDANRSGRSDTYTNNTNEDSGIADDVEEELERKRREQEEEERRRREEQERLRRLEEERREQRRQQQEEERRQYQEEQRRREREDQEARERLERAERDAKERLKLQEEEREREELERQREQLLRLQEEQQAREQRERERRNREEIERRQRELEDQIREEEERKRQEEERKKRELLQKQQKAIPSAPEQVSRRKNRLDTDSAKERRRDEKERLLDDLQRVRQDRQDTEREREDLVRRAKTLQNRTQHKRNRARDAWKKMYFEEKKKTPPLEQEVNRLRHSLDLQHKKYVNQIEGKEGRRKNAYNQPSEKTNLKVQIAKHQHDLEELRRRVENTKMKLTTEMKLRNQAETELRALRAELTQKKINVTLSRSQQLQALQESEESMSYMSPRSPLPTRRHGGLSPRIQ